MLASLSAPQAPPTTVTRHSCERASWELHARPPHPALREHVLSYCGFAERSAAPFRRREVACAVIPLIISFGPPWWLEDPAAGRAPERRRSFVAGLWDSPVLVEHAGESHGVQIDFTPLGAHLLLGVPMHELAGRVVELDELLGAAGTGLVDRLAHAPAWEARFALLDDVIARRLAAVRRPPPPATAWAWRRIVESGGAVRVGELVAELGCSRRHLAGQFREQLGLSPKAVAGIVRFQRVATLLARDAGSDSLADAAYTCGYFDQAHFNRDFRRYAGVTPSAYVAALLSDGGGVEALSAAPAPAGAVAAA